MVSAMHNRIPIKNNKSLLFHYFILARNEETLERINYHDQRKNYLNNSHRKCPLFKAGIERILLLF
jgi:hypothetical protein